MCRGSVKSDELTAWLHVKKITDDNISGVGGLPREGLLDSTMLRLARDFVESCESPPRSFSVRD